MQYFNPLSLMLFPRYYGMDERELDVLLCEGLGPTDIWLR